MALEREADVHAVDGRDERRHREKNRRRGQVLHHVVQVVVDERGERVEGAVQDVRVNGGRLQRLLVLDERVVEEVTVVLRQRQLPGCVRAGERDRVGLQARGEVYESLLYLKEPEYDLVRDGLVQLVFQRRRARVYVVYVAQEEPSRIPGT